MNKELISLLERESKGSRQRDEAVADALGLKPFRSPRVYRPDEIRVVSAGKARNLPKITTSVDAVLALAEGLHGSQAALSMLYNVIDVVGANGGSTARVPLLFCAVLLSTPAGAFDK